MRWSGGWSGGSSVGGVVLVVSGMPIVLISRYVVILKERVDGIGLR